MNGDTQFGVVMARFDKLEFGETPERREQASRPAAARLDWADQALEERRSGHFENALRLYSRALEDDKSQVQCWVGQVQMLVQLEESVEAELWSRKALELFPGNGDLLAGRAQATGRMGSVHEALVLSDGSLKSAGQSAYRWIVRGELMVLTRQENDRHCFEKAVQIDKDWLIPLEIARSYLEFGVPSRGLEWIRRAVERAPERCYPWFLQGEIEMALGLESAAEKSWQRCLELSPGHVEADRRLADFSNHWSLGRFWRRLFGGR